MKRLPEKVRSGLRTALWKRADELQWPRLSWHEKAAHYEAWSRDPEIGGLLANYLDPRRIRVYIKDTLMKGYLRKRSADVDVVFQALCLDRPSSLARVYERPHGRRLGDGREIAWSAARDWKAVLMALHERTFGSDDARPYGAVLLRSGGKYADLEFQRMVESAAAKLGVERVAWRR